MAKAQVPKNLIGSNLRRIRSSRSPKITQEALAARLAVMGLNIDRVAISKIETGVRSVADYELLAIARTLNLPLQRLIGNESWPSRHGKRRGKKRG